MMSQVYTGQRNIAWLYHNGQRMEETRHGTHYSENSDIEYTGGREVMVRAQQGDTLHLGTATMGYNFYYIRTCFQFVNF